VDPLTEVLRSVRLAGTLFLSADLTAPWHIGVSVTQDDCAAFSIPAAQIISYHVVLEGRLLAKVEGDAPMEVRAGEIVLLPRNDLHRLASDIDAKSIDSRELIQQSPDGGLLRIDYGGGGERTRIVCGFLASQDSCNPLFTTLPRVMKIDVREGATRDWIESSVRFAANELTEGKLATSNVMTRLSESLLTEAVRRYSSTLSEEQKSWLNGLKDQYVGRALALIHGHLSAPWSPESLAKEVGLSRSAFVDRFTAALGVPPIRYLTIWRLQTARLNLRETRASIAQIAHGAGYESEAAFSRAFKREFGVPPATWRSEGSQ